MLERKTLNLYGVFGLTSTLLLVAETLLRRSVLNEPRSEKNKERREKRES